MDKVGIAASVIVGLALLGGVVVLIQSAPELARYRRIRKM
jgi:hypothetical protein